MIYNRASCLYHVCQNFIDGVNELKQSSTAWLEIGLALCALASGLWIGWPFYHPYQSDVYQSLTGGVPGWVWGVLWVAQGSHQGIICFFAHREKRCCNKAMRRHAAAIGAALWGGVTYVLIVDMAPGWMTAIAPVFLLLQIAINETLRRRRRETDL